MNKRKGKYIKMTPNYLTNIVSPMKTDQTYLIQLQEPINDRMNPIKSSIGFSSLHDDYYLNEFNAPKQVEIANDRDQNNEEIIVNNMLHEKIIDQNFKKEDLDYLLNPNDINHLDFITTLLRLQKPKSGKVIQKNDDESKNDIKEIIDLCEERNNKRVVTTEKGYTNNITANCNLDSFLNDITPRKKGFEPQTYSTGKKGLTIKDLIDITNKRKKHLNSSNNKGYSSIVNSNNENAIQQIKSIGKNNQGQITKLDKTTEKKGKRHSSTGSVRYNENNNIQSQMMSNNDKMEPIPKINQNNYQYDYCLFLSSENNKQTKCNTVTKKIDDRAINTSNYIIEQNSLKIEPFTIISSPCSNSLSVNHLALFDKRFSNSQNASAIENKKINSNQINKFELYNTIPEVHQNDKVANKESNLIYPKLPISGAQAKPYSYGAFNLEINNKIYLPNSNSYPKSNNSQPNNKQIISIKPIECSSINDFVNYGSNPLVNQPKESRTSQINENESSLIIPLNPDSQFNEDFNIQMAEMDSSSSKSQKNVSFSMEQSSYQYNRDQLNNYKTNLSEGSSKEEEPSQVNEYDIDKNQKQNESKEIKFINNHSTNTNTNIASINLSKLTNFVEMQSKKNFSVSSNANPCNQPSTEKKELVIAEIDLFADDNEDQEKEITNQKSIINHHSKEQPSPYTQELNKKLNYFDELSLIAKENAYGSLKHSIVESIKERPIEYDIDELVNPLYLLKSNQISNKSSQLSKSFYGGVTSSIPTGNKKEKNYKKNLSLTSSSIEKKISNVGLEKKVTRKSIQSYMDKQKKDKTLNNKRQKKYIKNTKINCSHNKVESSTKSMGNIKEKQLYKFESRQNPHFSEGIINKQIDSKLKIVPCEQAIQLQIDGSKEPNAILSRFTSLSLNKCKYNLDAFSIEVPQTNSSKKIEYSYYVNDLITDSQKNSK